MTLLSPQSVIFECVYLIQLASPVAIPSTKQSNSARFVSLIICPNSRGQTTLLGKPYRYLMGFCKIAFSVSCL